MMYRLKLIFALCCAILITTGLQATIQDTVSLERAYEHRIQSALDALYGEGSFVTRVNVLLSEPKYRVRYTRQSNVKKTSSTAEYEILPGYPVLKNLANSTTPYDSETTYVKPKVKKVVVRLIVREGLPGGKVTRTKELIPNIINVNPKLVTVETETQGFYQKPSSHQNIAIIDQVQRWFTLQNLFYVCALILLYLFMKTYQEGLDLQQAALASKSGSGEGSGGGAGIQRLISSNKGGSDSGPQQLHLAPDAGIKRYFSFVTEDNVENFLHIIRKEQMSIENIAVITSFLPPNVGAKVIASLDLNKQATVALNMLNQKTVNRQNIEKLESHIKSSLECLVGGKQHFQKTFNLISSDIKKKVLDVLSKASPEGYQNFRNNIIIFDDLKVLSDDEAKLLISSIHMDQLAKALTGIDKAVYQKFYDNMTPGAKDLLKQTLDLKGKSYSQKDINDSREAVLTTMHELESDDLFNLSERIKG